MNNKFISITRILLPLILGSLIGFIIGNFTYYETLIKPPLSPSKIIFPIAWSIIYLLMGISYNIIINKTKNKKLIQVIYYLQLIVNLLWSPIFFTLKLKLLSVIWILLLLLLVSIQIKVYYKENKISSYLNIPYILWIIFATYLTIGIYILN